MQIVYHAAHSVDAQLVRNLLAQEGIQAFVFGAALEGGAGELPVGGSVRLEVADQDAPRAREIIQDWQASVVPLSDDEDDGAGDGGTSGTVENGNADRPLDQSRPGRGGPGMTSIVIALALGAVLGAVVTAVVMQPRGSSEDADYNGDGVADERLIFEGDRLLRAEADRNGDGDVDMVTQYDARGLPTDIAKDQDFNGSRESTETYRDGLWAGRGYDYSGDGAPELEQTALRGVIHTEQWLDPQGRVIKRNLYTGGRLTGGEIDSDGDGVLDTSRLYDSRGEVQSSQPLQTQ